MTTDQARVGRRLSVRSVRVRATLAVVAVVAVAMSAGAVLFLVVLRGLLTEELADAMRTRAEQIASAIRPGPFGPNLLAGDFEDDMAQLIRADGRVVASSPNAAGMPALTLPAPSDWTEIVGPDSEPMIAIAQVVEDEEGLVLLVARSTDSRDDALHFVSILLTLALPALCLVVAVLTWAVVGRALGPVEAIRQEVDKISSTALHRRVPESSGGDEISRLSRTMNRMLDRLEHAQERQRRFASDASHELRSPVAAIRQYAEVAIAHPETTSVPELARTVLNENMRVQRLVEDLLLLARVDEHSLRLMTTPLDLDDLVFDEARRLRETTALRVESTAVSTGRITGDIAGMRRVLRNLGENAARHARSTIAFNLVETAAGVQLIIDDDGAGIPDAERERVLQRFVRLDEARDRDSGGSGLGLAIVAELVAAHDGTLSVEPSPTGGARLRLTFPPVPAQAPVKDGSPTIRTEPKVHRSGPVQGRPGTLQQ